MSSNYIQDLLAGRVGIEDFDDAVDEWHDKFENRESGSYPEIYEFLGMTWPEYSLVMRKRANLRLVLASRKRGEDINSLAQAQTDWALAARSSDDSELLSLIERLRREGVLKP